MADLKETHTSPDEPTTESTMDIAFGRTVVPVPLTHKPLKKDMLGFEYAEHGFIGDAIYLTLADGNKVPAIDQQFKLESGLSLTYGQINGLSGDFYGTSEPISDGKDDKEQAKRFMAAYNTLAGKSSRQPKEGKDILAVLQAEVDAVNDALRHHQDPSVAYSKLPGVNTILEAITFASRAGSGIPTYLGLARINWDHFGVDARRAYNAGHSVALQRAVDGDLTGAYVLNAFADHFLEDSFSAGHLRTPRRSLHRSIDIFADACAKYMHDEDNAIGITVKNPAGDTWVAFGDKRALDEVDKENLRRCVSAVQASADEVYNAYSSKEVPTPRDYKAWTEAPTLESARDTQILTSLFTFQAEPERREIIENRRLRQFKTDWWFLSTAAECLKSGWWKYPIKIDGPPKVASWSSLAVTNPRLWKARVYYQNPEGGVLESCQDDGDWSAGVGGSAIFEATPFTSLAAINWNSGNEIRVYYLNEQYILQEYCYSKGRWAPGALNKMNIQVASNTSIAALQFGDSNGGVHIRVYCQESGHSHAIQEFSNDGSWHRDTTITTSALSGTGIAAVAFYLKGRLELRVYYQAANLALAEVCWSGSNTHGWTPGQFHPSKAPGRTPITAVGWCVDDHPALQVYWMNTQREVVQCQSSQGWQHINKVVGPLGSGAQFAAAQWENGTYVRLYYQSEDNSVLEICNDHEGGWFVGTGTIGQA